MSTRPSSAQGCYEKVCRAGPVRFPWESIVTNRRQRRKDRAQHRQPSAATQSKRLPYLLIGGGALVVAAAVAVVLFAALARDSGSDSPAQATAQDETDTTPTQVVPVADNKPAPTPTQDQPAVETALVTLEEFGDFQCSHCAQFARGMGKQLKEDFVNTGRIRFVFRHFPFIGEESFRAAEATECAADQNKFWEYHDTVFENWKGVNQGAYSDDNLKGFAGRLQLDRDAFDSCLDSGKYRGKVEEDLHLGNRLGVEGTPTLFLQRRRIQVASYSELAQLIESAIAAAR